MCDGTFFSCFGACDDEVLACDDVFFRWCVLELVMMMLWLVMMTCDDDILVWLSLLSLFGLL